MGRFLASKNLVKNQKIKTQFSEIGVQIFPKRTKNNNSSYFARNNGSSSLLPWYAASNEVIIVILRLKLDKLLIQI